MGPQRFLLCILLLTLAGCGQTRPTEPAAAPAPRTSAASPLPATVAPGTQPGSATPAFASPAPATVSPTPAADFLALVASPTPAIFVRPADAPGQGQVPTAGGAIQPDAEQAATNPLQALGTAPGESQNSLLTLFPELSSAPAPAWLAEGVRVTYYIQSVGPAAGPDETTSYGAGLMQYDLVAVDTHATLASWRFYLDQGGGSVTPSGAGISRGIPGVGEYWVQPDVLRDAERAANDELAIVHMPTTISGQSYQAVRFEYRPPNATFVWMYDAASGVLLFYRHAIGPEEDPKQSAQMIFLGRRGLSVPWRAGSMPAWAEGNTLRYEGEIEVLTLGSPTATFPYAILAEPQGRAGRYVDYQVTEYTAGQISGRAERVTGLAQLFDALWLPPEALGRRALLDSDPLTGAQVAIAPGDGGTTVLTESAPAYRTVLTYDGRTGQLLSLEEEKNAGLITTRVTLRLAN